MKAVLRMELIGDDLATYLRAKRQGKLTRPFSREREQHWLRGQNTMVWPYVARITGLDARYGLARQFVRCQKDYAEANGTGSRGVYGYYVLDPGIYEVNERESWRRTRRYYIRIEGETITEIKREEVLACLNDSSASAS